MATLTSKTTQADFVAGLKAALALTPSNAAIARHLAKVEAMTAEEWPAHLSKLLALGKLAAPAVQRMVAETFAKTRKAK